MIIFNLLGDCLDFV
jgi:hypothetical protein